MDRSLTWVYATLVFLTITSMVIFNMPWFGPMGGVFILGLSLIKIIMIAFHFMELKLAHVFWRIAYLFVICLIIGLILLYLVSW